VDEVSDIRREFLPPSTTVVAESVNAVSEDSQQLPRHLGESSKDFVARNVNTREQNGLDHQFSRNHPACSGGLSTTFRMAQSLNGNSPDAEVRRYVEPQNAGTGASLATNAIRRGRKGQTLNGNHLLNFYSDPIPRAPRAPPRNLLPRRQQRIKPYNKDLFLQANFRFLVSDMGDYVLNSSNPDKMLQWEDVAAVNFSTPNHVQCPICLDSPPLCPQITTCGHIFCFPCILRYLMMGEGDHKGYNWKKCPLCSIMISCKDLHTVCIGNVKQYDVGKHIDFTLLTRAKSSVIPFEKNQHSLGALPHSIDGQCNAFSRFTLTYDPELSASKAALKLTSWIEKVQSEGGEDLELLPYVYAARDQLEERKKAWTERRASEYLSGSPPLKQRLMAEAKTGLGKLKIDSFDSVCPTQSMKIKSGDDITFSNHDPSHQVTKKSGSYLNSIANSEQLPAQKAVVKEDDPSEPQGVQEYLPKCGDKRESDKGSEKLQEIKTLEDIGFKHQNENTEHVDEESYSFYQSADGQFLILHPLNMKCLLHHYGSHNLLPSRIGGKILQLETFTQSEVIRKRFRYLSHFPLTTTFQLCEIDLSDLLPASAFFPFTDEIEKRNAERRRRRKQEARAKRVDSAVTVQARPVLPEFTYVSTDDKPPSSADFEALGEPKSASVSSPVLNERKLFSHVTRLGLAAGYDSPALKEGLSGDLSPGSMASTSNSINMERAGVSADGGTSSSSTMSFADIITAPKPSGQECSRQVSKSQSSGKKGKKASKVLLSTAGGRRY